MELELHFFFKLTVTRPEQKGLQYICPSSSGVSVLHVWFSLDNDYCSPGRPGTEQWKPNWNLARLAFCNHAPSPECEHRSHLDHCVGCTCHMNKCVCFCTKACWPDGRRTQCSLSYTLIYHLFTNDITGWSTALWLTYRLLINQLVWRFVRKPSIFIAFLLAG